MKPDPRDAAVLLLAALMKMSDDAQALGGATSLAGVASLHKMQTSIQKNRNRVAEMCAMQLAGTPSETKEA